ncbi:hypothetical protein RND81_01G217100 [Saponaria officinalis]|uniref:X8 domain-containing protein n=1 Tax=Saponaria officinalis TaxID=3572 RepID=A0AAW1NHK1_SAPOF
MLCILALILFTIVESREQRELRGVATTYCVAVDRASNAQLQGAINYVCSKGVNCGIIKPGGSCYNPNTLNFHASAVMNAYFKAHGAQGPFCAEGPLKNIGMLTFTDPSQGSCKFS